MSVPGKKNVGKNKEDALCVGTQHVAKDSNKKGISGKNCNRHQDRALLSYKGNELTNKTEASDPVISVRPVNQSERQCCNRKLCEKRLHLKDNCLLEGGSQHSFVYQDILVHLT